jgi:hypothetical protein
MGAPTQREHKLHLAQISLNAALSRLRTAAEYLEDVKEVINDELVGEKLAKEMAEVISSTLEGGTHGDE